MERTFPLKAQNQSAWLRHLRGVIFDGFPRFQYLSHFLRSYSALKHALERMDAEENFGINHSWNPVLYN